MATSQTQTLGKLNWQNINKQMEFWQNLGFALLEISLWTDGEVDWSGMDHYIYNGDKDSSFVLIKDLSLP